MALNIIVPNVVFPKRTQLYSIPSIAKNHVFAVFGENREKSLVNLNATQANATAVGDVAFSSEGLLALGNTNYVRFKLGRAPNFAGCTLFAAFKTRTSIGDAGVASLWSESSMSADANARRIFTTLTSGVANLGSTPSPTSAAAERAVTPGTEYLISLTRAVKGTPSRMRIHNPDGSVAVIHPITEYTGNILPYSADPVFDLGIATSSAQAGAFIQGAALYSGNMSEAEISAAAARLYQLTHTG